MTKQISKAEHCARLIHESKKIAVLTGAGISTSAGIPDFRGPQGLYVTKRYDPEKIFDIDYFYQDPEPFFEFARDFIKLEGSLKPTFAHSFLAKLENLGKLSGIITQNIDSLHHQAGSKNVLEMHGSFWTGYCMKCHNPYTFEEMKIKLVKSEIQ